MAIEVRVTWDVRALVKTLEGLSSPRLDRAAVAALNDTVKNAQVQAAKLAAPLLNLPSRDVKAAMRVAPATPQRLEAALVTEGRPVPLIRFKPRDTHTRGVAARIGRKTDTYRHAFIATLRSGYRGVWERAGTARGPLRQLYGPSVPGMVGRRDVLDVVTRTMDENLLKNLRRQVDRQLRAGRGLAGSRTVG